MRLYRKERGHFHPAAAAQGPASGGLGPDRTSARPGGVRQLPHFGGPVRPAAPDLSGGPGDALSAGLQQQGDRPAALPDPDGGEHPHRPGPGAAEKIGTGGGDTSMTDQELDRLMRHVLMDGIGQEAEQTL